MASRNHSHRSHIGGYVLKVDAYSKYLKVGMWPELNVLVPFHFFSTAAPLKVELGMMELYVWTKQIFRDIDEGPLAGKGPVFLMEIGR